MKKNYILLAFIALGFGAKAQTSVIDTITFEPINLALDTFWNGKDQSGGFSDPNFQDIEFKTVYDTNFGGFWSGGFAQSTVRDSVDGSFNNLYGSRSANGANGSSTYTIFSPSSLAQEITYGVGANDVSAVKGLWVNNTTYAYEIIKNGNQFSRAFGDTTGGNTGEDFFFITFYDGNGDSVNFYLADYRFSDSAMDYIIKDWTYVDLTLIDKVERMELTTSDVGQFGSNTPSYFAVDNIVVERPTVGTEELSISNFNVYPNPTTDYLNINLNKAVNSTVSVLNANGQVVLGNVSSTNKNFVLNVQSLKQGTYFVQVIANNKVVTKRFIKQ